MRFTKPEPGQPVTMEINGRELTLKYSLGTLKRLDIEQKISVLKGDLAQVMQDAEKLAIVLYYGVRTTSPDVTLEWVEENFDASMLFEIAPILTYCMMGKYPDMEKLMAGTRPNGASVKSENGSASGPMADTISPVLN